MPSSYLETGSPSLGCQAEETGAVMTLRPLGSNPPPGPLQMWKPAFYAIAASWQEEGRFDGLITQGHKWLFLTTPKEGKLALD